MTRLRILFFFLLVFAFFQNDAGGRTLQSSAGLVVADSEQASQAGMEILRRGGNAVDAAIATALALSVVDQASSGLGGGGFMVIYHAKDHKSYALDFRETAPAASRRELYMKDGKPMPSLSLTGALAVAVPGEAAGLIEARKRFGSLPLTALAAPAIKLATEGFLLDPALRVAIERQQANMKRFADLGRIYMPGGELPRAGDRIRQPELAGTLNAIAKDGAAVFYGGWVGQAIVETIKKAGGIMTLDDLKNYRPVWREPLIGSYRNRTVITMPPPSSGGVAILEMLNVLEGYKLRDLQHNSASYLHLLTESMKHAFADRAEFLGDPDFVHVPVGKLTAKNYAEWIRKRIAPDKTQPPRFYGYYNYNAEKGGTTHFSVIDRFGNAVACTQSVNTRFGSKLLVPRTGIVLNNEMDDFAIHPGQGNVYGLIGNVANSLSPSKRPLSSMSPTIVLRGNRPELVLGAAGGPRIVTATLQTIVNVLDFGMTVTAAVSAPRAHHQWLPDRLNVEPGISADIKTSLEQRGHALREQTSLGVVQAISWEGAIMKGAADPRKVQRARTE
ncbi:MAG TPA: gamma-glutamyltransferase [Candidatus Binatia bacterium]|jgi:gamma-glutamyltranspeptidase / glutathione hydrolase|nr:gamma-glutamyltransferase [Candidatus Binatia bacterium]